MGDQRGFGSSGEARVGYGGAEKNFALNADNPLKSLDSAEQIQANESQFKDFQSLDSREFQRNERG